VRKVILGCVALGALSLLLPARGLHFDSWAWVLWGRQIDLLELDTLGGPSWKPFPVLFTIVYAPFSKVDDGIPPMLWLATARAGGFLSLAMAYRLAGRLAGPEQWVKILAGLLAGAILLFTPRWLLLMAQGYSEPLAAGLLFWAIERHLDGRRDHALILGFLVALNRPESWPFLGLYAAYLWWQNPELRKLVAVLVVVLPLLWIVPEWIGSGNPFSAGEQARSEPPWSLSRAEHPFFAALGRASGQMLHPLKLAALFAVGWGFWRRDWRIVVLGAAVGVWIFLVAVMTREGFSGNPRYFMLVVGISAILAAIGVARLIALASSTPERAAIAIAIALLIAPFAAKRAPFEKKELVFASSNSVLHRDLTKAIDRVGGPAAVTRLGYPYVNRGFITHMAWDLKLPIRDIQVKSASRRIVFMAHSRNSGRPPKIRPGSQIKRSLRSGKWRIVEVVEPPASATAEAPR
jgi:hypothetical protein